jgi:O-antigen/teichoic acid export membrane protein
VLGAASVVAIGLNYVFLLAAGRLLGSEDYGALAALLGLLTLVLLPTGAIQLAVSRDVARHLAVGERDEADAFGRATLRLALVATVPIVALGLVLAIPLGRALHIESRGVVLLTAAGLVGALTSPIAMGVLQGYQRFGAVAGMQVFPSALRLGLLGLAALVGLSLGGAVLATVLAGLAGAGLALALVREPLVRGARLARPALGPFLRYLWPVLLGLIGISVLTTVDLLVVKARFAPDVAGEYAAASAFARIAFFVPATILTVLFPVTAARQARGQDTEDILGRSLLVTAAFGALLALFYGMAGRGLMGTSFGAEFADGGDLLVLFAVSMTLYSLANVLVGFHLSRGETRFAWMVACAVPVQLAVLALVPQRAEDVILANVIIGTALLAAHELFVDTTVFALAAGVRHFTAQAARAGFRGLAREGLIAFMAATAFVALLFWPLVGALGSTVVGDGSDASGMMAAFWWMQHEGGYHLFGTTHHILTGAPFGWDGGNGLNLQLLVPYYPAYLVTKLIGPVAAYNVVLLAGYVLSGVSMYLLTRYFGCNRVVAAWAGMVYIVFPWHLARTPHGSLVHLEFFPLLILALVAAAQRPSWWRFSLVGFATLVCWLTSGYFGVMAVVAAAAFALAAALASPFRRAAVLVTGSIAAAVGASMVVGVLSMISGFGRGASLNRVAGELHVYGVRPLELIVPSPGNLVLGGWTEGIFDHRQHGSNPTETRNYLGLVTLVLAMAWLIAAWRSWRSLSSQIRTATAGLTGIFVAALLLAVPSPLPVFGRDLWMPSRVLWEIIPAVRVPSRWVALAMTALVPLAALGLEAAWKKLAGTGAGRRAAYALVLTVVVLSFLELTVYPARPRFETAPPPRIYEALTKLPPGVVAEYPLLTSNDHIIWQTGYRRPLLNNAGFGSRADDARRVVLHPGAPGVAEALAFLGVTAIITHRDALSYVDEAKEDPNATWGAGYKLVTRAADGSSLWRVVARAAPALVTLPGGYGEPVDTAEGFFGFPLVSPSGVGTIEFTARAPSTVQLQFEATPPRATQLLRLADADTELPFALEGATRVSALVELPRGHSFITVKTDPAATTVEDAIVLSKPRARLAFAPPQLYAELISDDPGL